MATLKKVFRRRLHDLSERMEKVIQQITSKTDEQPAAKELARDVYILRAERLESCLMPEYWRTPPRSRRIH